MRAGRVGAYQPRGGDVRLEQVDGPPDWRGLLDLLEARTGTSFDDLWRTWVARPEDLPLLDARRAARTRYDAVVAKAADWRLPAPIRDAHARLAVRGRDRHARRRERRPRPAVDGRSGRRRPGWSRPRPLRTAFEGDDGFDAAIAEADAELRTIARYQDAAAARPVSVDLLVTLGLWDETPDADLVAARDAFARGDLSAVGRRRRRSRSRRGPARPTLGRGRVISLLLLAVAALVALAFIALWVRGHRRRRLHRMHAHQIKQ